MDHRHGPAAASTTAVVWFGPTKSLSPESDHRERFPVVQFGFFQSESELNPRFFRLALDERSPRLWCHFNAQEYANQQGFVMQQHC